MSIIRAENEHPGTEDWILSKTRIDPESRFRSPAIEGYCSRISIAAGDELLIYVSTDPPSPFTIDFYRTGYYGGKGARCVLRMDSIQGAVQPEPAEGPDRLKECGWEPSARLVIPEDWVSGVYIGKMTREVDQVQSYIIFIVRDQRRADFIFQCSDTTWQAYNRWPNQYSLYDDGKQFWYLGPGPHISYDRPFGKYCQIVDAPLSIGSGEWFLWEFPFAYWLESLGCDVTYISNLDLHENPGDIRRAKGFLSIGHDEYYTLEMFQSLLDAVSGGMSIAFFSSNVCSGRIRLEPGSGGVPNRIMSRIDRFGSRDPVEIAHFPDLGRLPWKSPKESELVGARSIFPVTGGADWACLKPEAWIFEGTGMMKGDAIPGLVGWEWLADPAQIDGLEVVAGSEVRSDRGEGAFTSTLYPGPKGNFVFNASTCWWADGLAEPPGYVRPSRFVAPRGPDRRVQRITTNILNRMRAS